MEPEEVLSSEVGPDISVLAVKLTKNQKKKRRRKISKKYKSLPTSTEQGLTRSLVQRQSFRGRTKAVQKTVAGETAALHSSLPRKDHTGTGTSPGRQPVFEGLQPPAPKLSVDTLQPTDRGAHTAEQRRIRSAHLAHSSPAAPPSSQRQGAAAKRRMQRRVDLSHAAALIHSQLERVPQLPFTTLHPTNISPSVSGCRYIVSNEDNALCATQAWVGCSGVRAGLFVHSRGEDVAVVASSAVTSTLTPPEATVLLPGGKQLAEGEAGHAFSCAQRKRHQGRLVWDSDAEEDAGPAKASPAGGGGGGLLQAPMGNSGPAGHEAGADAGWGRGRGQGGPQQPEEEQEVQGGVRHSKRRRVSVYGNYHRYYGYRLGQAFGEDPRLQCFERQWFANRRCLDVGCNEGVVTLALATKFGAKSMMGVDIDEHLIRKACMTLRVERSRAAVRAVEVRRGGTCPAERRAAHVAHAALAQTWFVHADFVSSQGEEGSFDTITCLSVAKWVHLNQGDAGLEALLAKCWRLLAPGGYFLLEPQPWKSYKAAAAKMRKQPISPSTYFHRLEELAIRPEELPSLLVDTLGFRLIKRLQAPSSAAAGFDRPMFLLRKPG